MAMSSLNTKIGPTNADIANATALVVPDAADITAAVPTAASIATAVAAPSAATIASSVAGAVPTLAQINTAVNTQTNNSAIASAVAGAVPTLAQINTSVANNAPSPNAWTVIGSVTVNNTSNTISFSGLSGYKSYRLLIPYMNISSTGSFLGLRINGDSGGNYTWRSQMQASGPAYSGDAGISNSVRFSNYNIAADQSLSGVYEIHNANLAGPKYLTFQHHQFSSGIATLVAFGSAQYATTSTVNSISYFHNAGNFLGGTTAYLYGAN